MGDFDDILGPDEFEKEEEKAPIKPSFQKIWEAYERSKRKWDKESDDEPENTGC